jgi:hypothetical protein
MPVRFPHRGQVDCSGQKLLHVHPNTKSAWSAMLSSMAPQDLNSHQVAALARRFGVPAHVFLGFPAAPPQVSAP